MRRGLTLIPALLLVIALGAITGCGDDDTSSAPKGSAANPMVAQTDAESAEELPEAVQVTGDSGEVANDAPQQQAAPCRLVTRDEAAAILGGPVEEPVQASQGPTCIYRVSGRGRQVTLTVQQLSYDHLRKRLRGRRTVSVGRRSALCGVEGRPVLHMQASDGRVLTIVAPCQTARAFAARAESRLRGLTPTASGDSG